MKRPLNQTNLPWTGERFVPGVEGNIRLEHLHRYAIAQELAVGKDVLDIACGEGYGSEILSDKANSVIGVDLSTESIAHARATYHRPNVRFIEGACSRIPLPDASVDLVVSFETIEHHDEHDAMMREIRRVLRKGGLLVISTPDKKWYSDKTGERNPFHVKELYLEEFDLLLKKSFRNVRVFGQRCASGSLIAPISSGSHPVFKTFRATGIGVDRCNGLGQSTYLIGVASDSALPKVAGGLFDGENLLAIKDSSITKLQAQLAEQTAWATRAAADVQLRDNLVADLQKKVNEQADWALALKGELSQQEALVADLRAKLLEQTSWAQRSASDVSLRDNTIAGLQKKIDEQTNWALTLKGKLEEQAGRLASLSSEVEVRDRSIEALRLEKVALTDWVLSLQTEIITRDRKIIEASEKLRAVEDSAKTTAADASFNQSVISELRNRLDEQTRRAQCFEEEAALLRKEHAELLCEIKDGVQQLSGLKDDIRGLQEKLQQRDSRLVTMIRGALFQRARAFLSSLARPKGPRVSSIHPAWTLQGTSFNVQPDGSSCMTVEGDHFSPAAEIVVGNRPLSTHRGKGALSAVVPNDLFARPGFVPVWVDNHQKHRALSNVACFRVLEEKQAVRMARRPGDLKRPWGWISLLRLSIHSAQWRVKQIEFSARRVLGGVRRFLREQRMANSLPALEQTLAHHILPTALPRKCDVVCFSIIDWDFRYQRPQQLLSRLAKDGHRVFYLSQKFLAPSSAAFRLRPIYTNVTELFLRFASPLNIYRDQFTPESLKTMAEAFLEFKAAVGLGETVCIVHLPFWTPVALKLQSDLGFKIVFDCIDDFSGFDNTSREMLAWESELARHADLVTCSSKKLLEKHASYEPILVPNAGDFEHFSKEALPAADLKLSGPVFGYYGAIAHWFDADLISFAAKKRPGWQFVLIGRADPAVQEKLKRHRNVHFVPEKPYGQLPAYLAHFDVCLIPFQLDELIKATNPVKFFEYMAAGKPVVAARMPELLPFEDQCYLYAGPEDFLVQAEAALSDKENELRIAERRGLAKANTWEDRKETLSGAISSLYPKASIILVTYNGLDVTKQCVESLLQKTAYQNWEAIIVDNASTDGTREYLKELESRYSCFRVILNDTNRGFAKANNQGIQASDGHFVVLLNNDTVVTHGWLGRLLRHLDEPQVGLVGPVTNNIGNEAKIAVTYRDLSGVDAFAESYTARHSGVTFDIPVLAMFCVAMRRSLLDEVGMLDERYEVGMFEDDDFSRSVKQKSYRVICAEDVFIHHVGGATFKKLESAEYKRIFESNRKRFEDKWKEPWVPHQYRKAGLIKAVKELV